MAQPTVAHTSGASAPPSTWREPANLGDILERVLDRGIVIAGDIQVNLLDIELLTIKLRLLVVSVDTAREIGIDWWEDDPWLTSRARPAVKPAPRATNGMGTARRPQVRAEPERRPGTRSEQRDDLDR